MHAYSNKTLAKLHHILYYLFFAIITALVLASNNLVVRADLQRNAPDPTGRRQLMVAIYCGSEQEQRSGKALALYHNQYYDLESRSWLTDQDAASYCTEDKQEIFNYCRKIYPTHNINNIVEAGRTFKLDNWCRLGSKKRCRTKLTVRPYRCLEGSFQSDALLVPEKCIFDHIHNKSACEKSAQWNKTATTGCQQKEGMALLSYSVLNPCGLGVFSGVEFVCCPTRKQTNTDRKKQEVVTRATRTKSQDIVNKEKEGDDDEKLNEVATDESLSKTKRTKEKDDDNDNDTDDGDEDDDDDEEESDEDEYDDDSSSWNGAKGKSAPTTSTTTTSTTTTTTTTTERPIDYYLSHFDLAHEHDDFRRAELAVENSYREKITHVMKEWSELEGRYQDMKKKNPDAAEEFKKKMAQRFEKTVEALEEEGAAERHQLISMHSERAMTIINRRKKLAMDCLTQALDRNSIATKQVERCIVRLLKALEKDRAHTLRQYKNLLNLNTREALREKNTILEHLVTLNRAANQSIAMLDRSPSLASKLKGKVITLWHNLRNIPIDEPILRESELKVMERYEEEVAQRKIEKERQRLIEQDAIIDAPQESSKTQGSNSAASKHLKDNNKNEKEPNNQSREAPHPDMQPLNGPVVQHTTTLHSLSPAKYSESRQESNHGDIDNEIHYQLNAAKYAHIKADAAHHELAYSIKHESMPNQLSFGYSAFLISACTAIVIVALIGVRYYTRNATKVHRRRGFAEVGRSDPEEKNVANMQVHGYENPAFKFFEADA